MNDIRQHPGTFEAPREAEREQEIRHFRRAEGVERPPVLPALEVGEVQLRRGRRGDGYHTRWRAGTKRGSEEICEQERTEEVRRKHQFDPVRGLNSPSLEHRSIVDKDVEPIVRSSERFRQGPHGAEIGEIRHQKFYRSAPTPLTYVRQ